MASAHIEGEIGYNSLIVSRFLYGAKFLIYATTGVSVSGNDFTEVTTWKM
jgi:hypothetical protein